MKDWRNIRLDNERRPVTEAEEKALYNMMEQAEKDGTLGKMFKGEAKKDATEQGNPSKDTLLESIVPDMKLYKSFFMKIYGYELSYPGFAQMALQRMKILGCSRAEEYYTCIVAEYEHNHEKEMKNVAEWYRQECDKNYENKKREAVRDCQKKNLQRMRDSELLTYLENLIKGD